MEKETLIFVVSVSGAIISILVMIVIGLISWSYQRDLSEKNRRIDYLEKQVTEFKDEWMGRPETQGLVNRVEQVFVRKHEVMSETISEIVESLGNIRILIGEQQLSWTNQIHVLGESINKTVANQIDKCSMALMERVNEQFKRSDKRI